MLNVGNDYFQKSIIEPLTEKCKIILIEPNVDLIPSLSDNYRELSNYHEIIIYPFGISTVNDNVSIFIYPESGHSSLIKRKSHWHKTPTERRIPVITFNNMCEEFSIKQIECLMIDTEGMDYEILNSINYEEIDIQTIIFEKWPFDEDDINGRYRTGLKFLYESVYYKLSNYNWDEYNDGDSNFILTKKN